MSSRYDALLIVSFGGPEGMDDVEPFLANVVRGRNVPAERLREAAAHYEHFGGRSPINDQCRALVAALRAEISHQGPALPVYWGTRNWKPFLADTVRQMACDGIRRAAAFVTAPFGSYSGCRQYLEDIARARTAVGDAAPEIDKLRGFHNHPGYVGALVEQVDAAISRLPPERSGAARLLFTAHSIPRVMAAASPYEEQVRETARLVGAGLGRTEWSVAYQSRSGPPSQPWLEPDIGDELRALAAGGVRDVVVAPIGFVSDHVEVLYDLDIQARARALELGMGLVRAETVGTHPRFVQMIRELLVERMSTARLRPHLGTQGPAPDLCPADCCLPPLPGGGRAA